MKLIQRFKQWLRGLTSMPLDFRGSPMKLVPGPDYDLIKKIRLSLAAGDGYNVASIEECERVFKQKQGDETYYINAKYLNLYYGMSKEELFQLTGCDLEIEKLTREDSNNGKG